MNIIMKSFLMALGVVSIVTVVLTVTRVINTTQTCTPADLYSTDDRVMYSNGFINSLYDSICSNVLNANSAIWGAYSSWITGSIGQRSNVASIGTDLWSIGSYFCQTHSNFEYVSEGSAGAVTDANAFLDLLTFETERCWTMFEGTGVTGGKTFSSNDRHPLGKNGVFDCSEIIYDFSDSGDYVSLAQVFAKMSYTDYCGNELNIPVNSIEGSCFSYYDAQFDTMEEVCSSPNIMGNFLWCTPNLNSYWTNSSITKWKSPTDFGFSGALVDSLTCETDSSYTMSGDFSTCLPFEKALCSISDINGYNNVLDYDGSSLDESAVIDGCGKIVISYFDYFNWGVFNHLQDEQDDYTICGYINMLNNFEDMKVVIEDNIIFDDVETIPLATYFDNSIVVCFEKFSEGDCNW